MATIYRDEDAAVDVLQHKTIAFVGYGNQGRSQARNMRDAGVSTIIIGNREDTYREQAEKDGFAVVSIANAVTNADVVMMLVPDEVQPDVFRDQIKPYLKSGATLCFASGYNVAYKLISPPSNVDVVMVAPRMIGQAVRDLYVQGDGFPAFIDVHHDATGKALSMALAIAKAIGALRTGSLKVSFAQEAWMDLLTEQAVWPLIMKVMEAAFAVQVEAGLPPEAVLLELYLSREPAEVFAHAAEIGLFKQMTLHSRTSQYGQVTARQRMSSSFIDDFIRATLHDRIVSGVFAQEWSKEQAQGATVLERLVRELEGHPIARAEADYWKHITGQTGQGDK